MRALKPINNWTHLGEEIGLYCADSPVFVTDAVLAGSLAQGAEVASQLFWSFAQTTRRSVAAECRVLSSITEARE